MDLKEYKICGNEIKKTAKKCLHCNHWIDGSTFLSRTAQAVQKNVEDSKIPQLTMRFLVKAQKEIKKILSVVPQWAIELPQHLRPSLDQISRLETLRSQVGISDREFFLHISSHPETTRKLQRYLYNQMKQQDPSASEQDILRLLVINRLTISFGSDLFGLETASMTNSENFDARLQEIVEMYPSLEALAGAIIQDEKNNGFEIPTSPEFENVARRVTDILSEP